MRSSPKYFFMMIVGMLAITLSAEGNVQAYEAPEALCEDDVLAIKFPCHPDWEIETVENAALIIMKKEPDITGIIARLDSRIKFLPQLTRDFLEEKGRYSDGFRIETVNFAGRSAVKVKAFSRENPDKRLLDYYFIHQETLFGLLFSVEPKDETEEAMFLFKAIADGFEFM